MKRALHLGVPLFMALIAVACSGGSSLDNSEAAVFLTIDIDQYQPEVNVCIPVDIAIDSMSVESNPKNPNASLTPNQDVIINRWVATPHRTDGGTVTSQEWVVDEGVYVPAGGSADLTNWRIYPRENFFESPLLELHPENGGIDPETGNPNVRQAIRLVMYGRTVSGKAVATEPINIQFNFFCN